MASFANSITRLRSVAPADRRFLLRAYLTLTMASLAVALLPFRHAIKFGSTIIGSERINPESIRWAVEASARRLPLRAKCIEKGLTAQRLLRAAGYPAVLHYGVCQAQRTGKLEAHVWVTLGNAIFIGGDEAAGFAEVAQYS